MKGLPCFASEMVFYSLTKFCVFQPCRKTQSLRIFDLGILEALNRDYSQRIKFLVNITDSLAFPKNGVVFGEQIWHYKAFYKYSIRLELGFCQTSKQLYRKLKYREKLLVKCQGLPHFSRKMVLHSLNKFCILSVESMLNVF